MVTAHPRRVWVVGSLAVVAVLGASCGGGDDDAESSTAVDATSRTDPPAATTTDQPTDPAAGAVDEPCAAVDVAAVESLIGRPVVIEGSPNVSKPGPESGAQCTILGSDADSSFLGGITIFRYAEAATAERSFDDDVVEFGDSDCYDGSPGGATDVEAEWATRVVVVDCGYTVWSVAGEHFVVTGVWPGERDGAPDLDQLVALAEGVHASLTG